MPVPQLFVTSAEFWAEFGSSESGELEFKESLIKASKLQESVVAFANARGGRVVLGVTDRVPREAIGLSWDEKAEERVQEVSRMTRPSVPLSPRPVIVDGRTLVVIDVSPIDIGWVHTSDGRVLVRAGPTNRTLMGDELARFIKERGTEPVEDQLATGAKNAADLEPDLVANYLQARLGPVKVDAEESLRKLGLLAPDGRPRLAANLLLGRDPQQGNRRFGIDILRFDGPIGDKTAIRDRRQLRGTLPELVEAADRAIYEEMRRDAVIRGLVREEVPEFPPLAIREALVNAVGHRDYSLRGSSIEIRLFADGLEIESPGGLAGWVTVENLRDAQYSRNERIMDALQVLGFVEEAGTGIDRMFAALDEALLAPPQFEERARSFVVRFLGQTVFSAEDRLWVAQFNERIPSGDAKVALVYARRHGAIGNEALRELRSLDAATSRNVLSDLVARGLLRQIGKGRGTRYALGEATSRPTVGSEPDEQVAAIVSHARRTGSVANRDVRGLLGVDAATARSLLELAVAKDELLPVGERRGRRYIPGGGHSD